MQYELSMQYVPLKLEEQFCAKLRAMNLVCFAHTIVCKMQCKMSKIDVQYFCATLLSIYMCSMDKTFSNITLIALIAHIGQSFQLRHILNIGMTRFADAEWYEPEGSQ